MLYIILFACWNWGFTIVGSVWVYLCWFAFWMIGLCWFDSVMLVLALCLLYCMVAMIVSLFWLYYLFCRFLLFGLLVACNVFNYCFLWHICCFGCLPWKLVCVMFCFWCFVVIWFRLIDLDFRSCLDKRLFAMFREFVSWGVCWLILLCAR